MRERVEKSSTKTRKTSFPNNHHQLFLEDEDGDINSSTLEFARVIGRFGVVVGVSGASSDHSFLSAQQLAQCAHCLFVCFVVGSPTHRAKEQHLFFPPLNLFFITYILLR